MQMLELQTLLQRVEFNNAQGIFAGEINDGDLFEGSPLDRCIWTGPITLVWNGSQGNDWNNPNNWDATNGPPTFTINGLGFVPTQTENVYIANVVNHPIITTSGQKTKNLVINL
jgi:hypothetical protein